MTVILLQMNVNLLLRILLCVCMSEAKIMGDYYLHGSHKAAINPYSSSTMSNSDCMSSCSSDSNCNGYSIDTSNGGCYLSNSDSYDDVPSCSKCFFASKLFPTSTVICTPETTTSDDSDTTTPGADTSSQPATTADRGMSTVYSQPTNPSPDYSTSGSTQITSNVTCVCVCEDVNITLQESIAKRKKELIVNKKELSSSIRKLTSAEDSRVSSRNIGVMGILVMAFFGFLSLCTDIFSVLRYFCKKVSKHHRV